VEEDWQTINKWHTVVKNVVLLGVQMEIVQVPVGKRDREHDVKLVIAAAP
jgi:hypothetical protein